MARLRWLWAGLILGFACTARAEEPALSPSALMAHVRVLTAPGLRGRAAGTPGEAAAADYVTAQLRALGLVPQRQAFPVPGGRSRNVYARIQGLRRDEIVIVGAHLDHLGVRNGSLYPGASDNASGVATVLGLARALSNQPDRPARSVLVAFFGAEELGLLGSRHFVLDPPEPLARVVAMVNVDSVGRKLADRASLAVLAGLLGIDRAHGTGILGTRHHPSLRALADSAFASVHDELLAPEDLPDAIGDEIERQARGRGDADSFEAAGVPTLFFSEGESSDYHAPGDTPERLQPEHMARRAQAILQVVRALGAAPRSTFAARSEPPAKRKPSVGLYLPVGLSTGAVFDHHAGFDLGAEVSMAYLWRSLLWLGAYADASRNLTAGTWRMSAGPELGYGVVGVDGGYLVERGGQARRRGFAARVLLGGLPVALACRAGMLGGDAFAEVGLLLKWPLALH
jgi:hypothetical protein